MTLAAAATPSTRLAAVAALGIGVVLLSGGTHGTIAGHRPPAVPFAVTASATPQFRVVNGAEFCEVVELNGSSCVTDGDGALYGNDEACEITVLATAGFLHVEFDTESEFDILTVGGVAYSGESGPDGVVVALTGKSMLVSWRSDGTTTGNGWTVCWVPTASPTASPTTLSPTVAAMAGSTCRRHTDCQMGTDSARGVGYCRMRLDGPQPQPQHCFGCGHCVNVAAGSDVFDRSGRCPTWCEQLFGAGARELEFTGAGLTQLPGGTFSDLSSLETLELRDNHLTALDAALFSGLGSLETLGLYNNDVTTLEAALFSGLGRLTSLDLGRNNLTTLAAKLFRGLSSLKRLFLRSNQFTTVSAELFSGLGSLELLYLNLNHFTTLAAELFSGLGSLKQLKLNSNDLATLDTELFRGLGSLEQLDLTRNRLTTLGALLFSGLGSLEQLKLGDNHLTTLDAELFIGLGSLEHLYLANNSLTTLDAALLSDLGNLTQLRLFANRLASGVEAALAPVWSNLDMRFTFYSPNPLQCDTLGPLLVCNECAQGYINDTAVSTATVLACYQPEFNLSDAGTVAVSVAARTLPTSLTVAQGLPTDSFIVNLTDDRRASFVGFHGDPADIAFELDFGPVLGIGCGRTVTGNTNGAGRTTGFRPNLIQPANTAPREHASPEHNLAFEVPRAGTGRFTFDSCESPSPTSLFIYNQTNEYDVLEVVHSYLMVKYVPPDVVRQPNASDRCPLGYGYRWTVPISEPGNYVLVVTGIGSDLADTSATYTVRMRCHGNATTVPTDPGGVSIDSFAGRISGSPVREGANFVARINAVDAERHVATLHSWNFTVHPNPPFGLSTAATNTGTMVPSPCAFVLADLRARSVDRAPDVGGLDLTELIDGFLNVVKTNTGADSVWTVGACRVAALFAGYAVDATTQLPHISFQVRVEDNMTGNVTDLGTGLDSLVSLETGRMSLTVRSAGRYRVRLQATTPRDGQTRPVDVTDFLFHVRTGPNMRGCGHNGAAVDPYPLGGNTTFQCSCTGGYGGPNCLALPDPDPSSGGGSDGADTAIQASLTAAVGVMFAAAVIVTARKRLAARLAVARLHSLATRTDATAADSGAYTAAMFEALDLGIDRLVPALVVRGADPDARHPTTHQHAHAIVLFRSDPDRKVLESLFRSSCIIDAEIGDMIAGPPQLAALETVLAALARDPPHVTSGTVLHTVVGACVHGYLGPDHAMAFSKRLLAADPSLLVKPDALGRTAGDLAMQCDDAIELERLLTVVLHGSFQLTNPSDHLYRSPTALVLDCRILSTAAKDDGTSAPSDWASVGRSRGGPSGGSAPEPPLVIKLMAVLRSWQREIRLRDALSGAAAASVVSIVSVASSDPDISTHVGTVELVRDPDAFRPMHGVASALTAEFPYAIVMEKADRNLLEIITNERLSAEPIGLIRVIAAKVGACIASLHDSGAVHGDIKPRNVVRAANHSVNTFKLIDLDMAYIASSSPDVGVARGLPRVHASARKIRETSAYSPPELIRWAQLAGAGGGAPDPITDLASAAKTDIWSFGVLLYELVTGRPLLVHAYDKASDVAEARLLAWDGLRKSEELQLHRLHQSQDEPALVDLLQWCLEPVPAERPPSMADVLAHAFFEPATGSMREHFAVQRIRDLLAADPGGHRSVGRVMISYSSANTPFVLDRLCMALAPLVEGMWLDRLGGDHGMGEWTRASLRKGIADADVVIAVVSPQYVKSKNCGVEMQISFELGKTIIPIRLGVPSDDWPPTKIGGTAMADQFADPQTGDTKLFVDFTNLGAFKTKFETELRPRIDQRFKPIPFGKIIATLQADDGIGDLMMGNRLDGIGVAGRTAGPVVPKELRRSAITRLSELGSGTFGTVYKAMMQASSGIEYLVAVKQLKVGAMVSESERLAFLKETAIHAQLRHPNVVGFVGVVTAGTPNQMVLQFCEQGGLDGVLSKNEHTTAQLVQFGIGIAGGMAYLAELRFVHRDLASRNVLLDSQGIPKVADFGLSKSLYGATYYTRSASTSNEQLPVRWLAPELFTDLRFSARTDAYSFGITLVEVFSKAVMPFGQWGNDMVISRVQDGFVHPKPPACPEAVYVEVIALCLANDPHDRPTFGKLGQTLQRQYHDLISDGGDDGDGDGGGNGNGDGDVDQTPGTVTAHSRGGVAPYKISSALPLHCNPYSSLSLHGTPDSALPLHGTPNSSLPLNGTPDRSLPLHGTPNSSLPLHGNPYSSLPLNGTPDRPLPLHGTPDSALPLHGAPDRPLSLHGGALPSNSRTQMRQKTRGSRQHSAVAGRADDPLVSLFAVGNPAYDAHMADAVEDPNTTTMSRVQMARAPTSVIGAAAAMSGSARRSEMSGLLTPASRYTEAEVPGVPPGLSGGSIFGHDVDGADGGYMDVEGTASTPDPLESDVPLITDTGLERSTAAATAPLRARRVSIPNVQTSAL